jgi:hypothetical protein
MQPNFLSDFSVANALLTQFQDVGAQIFLVRIALIREEIVGVCDFKGLLKSRVRHSASQDYEPLTSTPFASTILVESAIVKRLPYDL